MNRKILAIAIALLFVAIVAAPVAAAPVKPPSPTLQGKLYQSTYSYSTGVFSLGKNIGKIVIDKNTRIFTITTNPSAIFTPGLHTLLVAEDGPNPDHGRNLAYVMVDANGKIIDKTGTLDDYWSIDEITLSLSKGGWFMITDAF
jgi:hypothetical protein